MGKIKWTEKAGDNLKAIHEYIAKDSKIYATNFVKNLIKAADKLKKMPRCGRLVPEFEGYDLREVIYRNYRIVYRINKNKDEVEVLAVLHSARDLKSALEKEWEL